MAVSPASRSTPLPIQLSDTNTSRYSAGETKTSAESGSGVREQKTRTRTRTTTQNSNPPRLSGPPRSAGLLAIAAAALDKTISGLAEPRLRHRSLSNRLSIGGESPAASVPSSPETIAHSRGRRASLTLSSSSSSKSTTAVVDGIQQPDAATDPTRPLPTGAPRAHSKNNNKMHQTSSRLLRMTDDDRPFTKDFKDLFATLIVSLLPLSAHRVRLSKIEHTFLSEDAINNLGSLKFSQSNRMPDPKDSTRIVTTTTTTTFSMAKDMARSICQRFLEARFIESADGKYQQVYTMKGSVWQLTPKGISILDRFCSRNGIQQKQVAELIGASLSHLVVLERDAQSDKILTDRGTIEVIFRRFIGSSGPNVKQSVNAADSDSLSDYRDGLTGVKMAADRKVGGKNYKDTFTGKAASDWLMDCASTVDRRETIEIASLFVDYDLMEAIQVDRAHMVQFPDNHYFQPTKHAIYRITVKGKDLINGAAGRGRSSEGDNSISSRNGGIARDSNTQRLDKILNDPALRLLFRENLRETHCEENLSFYLDVDEFVRQCRAATRVALKAPGNAASLDGIKEIMAQALATRMTKAVGQDVAMIDTLHEVTALFEDAQNAVFKLMASDSVPKFLRSPKYEHVLKNHDFDSIAPSHGVRGPERSQSRTNRK
ncbi:hypothetical protein P8C59_000752 [Phyllachora maydis]|uniref:Uncharacterized protein n=1 Tax=Phyllachora maydis TaxID=1825666 RepID=A0AAD9M831_9PEZI|nr:hypothetical protein P8C59_000752 [Phyllachora maydis]